MTPLTVLFRLQSYKLYAVAIGSHKDTVLLPAHAILDIGKLGEKDKLTHNSNEHRRGSIAAADQSNALITARMSEYRKIVTMRSC